MTQRNGEANEVSTIKQVKERVGLGRTSIYKLVAEGKFPKPVHILGRNVAWVDSEVDEWMMDRIDEKRGLSVPNIRY